MDEEDTKHKTETVVVSGGGGRGGVGGGLFLSSVFEKT